MAAVGRVDIYRWSAKGGPTSNLAIMKGTNMAASPEPDILRALDFIVHACEPARNVLSERTRMDCDGPRPNKYECIVALKYIQRMGRLIVAYAESGLQALNPTPTERNP